MEFRKGPGADVPLRDFEALGESEKSFITNLAETYANLLGERVPSEEDIYIAKRIHDGMSEVDPQHVDSILSDYDLYGGDFIRASANFELYGKPEPDVEYKDGKGYEFFVNPEQRKEVFGFCRQAAEYLHDNEIGNLVLVDRAVRPLYTGLLEFWKSKYPEERPPSIFFINPKGFAPTADMTSRSVKDQRLNALITGDSLGEPAARRTREDIYGDFIKTYGKLIRAGDEGVLLLDGCSHSGDTIKPIISVLEAAGISDLKVGFLSEPDEEADIEPDFVAMDRASLKGCQPFDHDYIVEKNFDSPASKRKEDLVMRRRAVRIRKEIKRLVREFVESESE